MRGGIPTGILVMIASVVADGLVTDVHADSAFASLVYSYDQGGSIPFDFIDLNDFNNPATALGPPTVDTTSDTHPVFGGGRIPLGEQVPLVPVYPAFRSFEVVSIGGSGHLAVAFDHRVMDDPSNPYGLDLIVFGNTQLGADSSWSNRNPANIHIANGVFPQESGRVSVSQDGTNWIVITNAPYADHSFAPTLGRVYDPDNVDTNLGSWNQWWGDPSDPTFPVDPAIEVTNIVGWSVAKLARHYRNSAGGTGFDISDLPLSLDPTSGVKWIQYVRVENVGGSTPEIDAFSDVAPMDNYSRWQLSQFEWVLDPTNEFDHADPDGDGMANLMEYALNRNPNRAESQASFELDGVSSVGGPELLVTYERNTQAIDVVVCIQQTESLKGLWSTNRVDQERSVSVSNDGVTRITAGVPADQPHGFINLQVTRP